MQTLALALALALPGGAALNIVSSACVTLEDRCDGFVCDDGEICLDLDPGPTCVCDVNHEADETGACVPIEEEEGEGEGAGEGEGE